MHFNCLCSLNPIQSSEQLSVFCPPILLFSLQTPLNGDFHFYELIPAVGWYYKPFELSLALCWNARVEMTLVIYMSVTDRLCLCLMQIRRAGGPCCSVVSVWKECNISSLAAEMDHAIHAYLCTHSLCPQGQSVVLQVCAYRRCLVHRNERGRDNCYVFCSPINRGESRRHNIRLSLYFLYVCSSGIPHTGT